MILVPIFYFIAIVPIVLDKRADWKDVLIYSAIIWSVTLTLFVELSSYFKQINLITMGILWGAALVGTLFIGFINYKKKRPVSNWRQQILKKKIETGSAVFLGYTVIIIICTAIVAWYAPPNTPDSLAYHMSRVMHWIQNQSVDFYPTHITRQLYQNPWAEYAILNLQVLTGSDRLANFVQWSSMIGCIIATTAIAEQFQADWRGQIFTALVCATIPMGILQATSTQNNYVLAFWLSALAFYVTKLKKEQNPSTVFAVGASLGLAVLTKATAYIFAFPFIVWMIFREIALTKIFNIKNALIIALIAFLLNTGQYYRTFKLTGSILGPSNEGPRYSYVNEAISPRLFASNVVRNVALHTTTPFDKLNSFIWNGVLAIHKNVLLVDLNDKRITWLRTKFYIYRLSGREDYEGNPLHLFLAFFSLFFIFKWHKKDRGVIIYILCLIVGFTIFCLILRWQPWHSRLHLPLFVLSAPLAGIVLEKTKKMLANFIIALLILASIPYLFFNEARPLFGPSNILATERADQYLYFNDKVSDAYQSAAKIVSQEGCPNVGLILVYGDFEYALWEFIKENCGGKIPRIESVNVENESANLDAEFGLNTYQPKIIITTAANFSPSINYHNHIYEVIWQSQPLYILKR